MTVMDWAADAACQGEDPELFFPSSDEDLSWQDLARCAETDPEIFFPEENNSPLPAKRVCAGCSVKRDCLLYALGRDEQEGVWGGLDWIERRNLGPAPSGEAITVALSRVGMKFCPGCPAGGAWLPVARFHHGGGKYYAPCKDCMNARVRVGRARQRAAMNAHEEERAA